MKARPRRNFPTHLQNPVWCCCRSRVAGCPAGHSRSGECCCCERRPPWKKTKCPFSIICVLCLCSRSSYFFRETKLMKRLLQRTVSLLNQVQKNERAAAWDPQVHPISHCVSDPKLLEEKWAGHEAVRNWGSVRPHSFLLRKKSPLQNIHTNQSINKKI